MSIKELMKQQGKGLGELEQRLSKAQLTLKFAVRKYQNLQNQLAVRGKIGYDNNQTLLATFLQVVQVSFKPIELILRFLQQSDILTLASTCQSLYRLIYSPLGYRIMRALRPMTVRVRRERQMPVFNKVYLENLCSEVSLAGLDEDDRAAIVQTMRTNLMAARQKQAEIERAISQWDIRKKAIRDEMIKAVSRREQEQKRIQQSHEQIQKLNELLQQSSDNVKKLREQQEKMTVQRENRKKDLETQRDKLARQKELLIKKIKSQQKQREEGLIYDRQVKRVTAMLNRLTLKK